MMMTKRERFQNFLANKPVDRVPVAFFHHFCNDFGRGLADPQEFELNVMGHKRAREIFDPDVIKVMNDSLMIMPLDISAVSTPADLPKVLPQAMSSLYVEKSLELTRRVLEFYKGSDAPTYITSFSPSFTLRVSIGKMLSSDSDGEVTRKFLAQDPVALSEAVQIVGEGIIEFNKLLLTEGGAEGVYYSVNNQAGFFDGDLFRRYIAAGDKAVLDAANQLSSINMLHICGYHGKANDLSLFADFDTASYNWAVHAEGVSLSEGKAFFHSKPVCGGFEQADVIYKGSREEVEQATFRILDEAGQVGVMLGADCTVPTDIDDDRLNWVRDAAEKYAKR